MTQRGTPAYRCTLLMIILTKRLLIISRQVACGRHYSPKFTGKLENNIADWLRSVAALHQTGVG